MPMCSDITHVFQSNDVWMLPISQENLDFFRGVSFALINYLEYKKHGAVRYRLTKVNKTVQYLQFK